MKTATSFITKHNTVPTKRLQWLDMAKGVCMILVIYGHACYSFGLINQWICSFFMGLFFMSSGYTYHYKKNWLFNNIQTILIPYLLWAVIGLIYIFAKSFAAGSISDLDIAQRLLKAFTGIASDNYPLWFLVAFLLGKSAYDIIIKIISCLPNITQHQRIALEIISVIAIALAAYLYTLNKPFGHSIMRFDTGLIMLPFFTIGRYTPRLFLWIDKFKISWASIGIFFILNVIAGLWLNNLVSVNSNEYGNILLFYVSTMTGTWAVFLLCKKTEAIDWIRIPLALYGVYSLVVLCCHFFFLTAIMAIEHKFLPALDHFPIVATVLCLIIMAPFLKPLKKFTILFQNNHKK